MPIETLEDIVEDLANKLGIYGAHETACGDTGGCRVCFTLGLQQRILDAVIAGVKLAQIIDWGQTGADHRLGRNREGASMNCTLEDKNPCPVCGYFLDYPVAHYNICPSCGTGFVDPMRLRGSGAPKTSKKRREHYYCQLEPSELELLALLSEEMGEVQQVIGKIVRHGLFSCDPTGLAASNRTLLEKELGDVAAAVGLLASVNVVRPSCVNQYKSEKLMRVGKYLHHNKVEGVE